MRYAYSTSKRVEGLPLRVWVPPAVSPYLIGYRYQQLGGTSLRNLLNNAYCNNVSQATNLQNFG